MRSRGPLITLLAGLALAGVLVTLSVNASRDAQTAGASANAPAANGNGSADNPADVTPIEEPAADATTAPADPPEDEAPADGDAAAPPAENKEVTWAGRVKGGKATVAISTEGDQAIAYVCNGSTIESWLQGSAADGKLDLSAKSGKDSLVGTFTDGRAKGTITIGSKEFTFSVATAKKPNGLYRTAATVRGAKLVGGWIVLADGTQVGVANYAGSPVSAPPLDLSTRTTTIYGEKVTAQPASPGDAW